MLWPKNINRGICLILVAFLAFSACGKQEKVGELSETGGVSRDTVQALAPIPEDSLEAGNMPGDSGEETDTSGETAAPDTPAVPASGEPTYSIVNGKYTYSIPEPDRSGLSDLSDIKAIGNALFSDNGEDTTGSWYPGKTERNLATGEVTYVWDRTKDTLAVLDKYDGIYRKNEDEKVVYLTFDCGYENGWTDPILDVLKEKNAPGLFFLTGHYVESAEAQIRRMLDEGHVLGNHTVNHINATKETEETFISEITGLEQMIKDRFPDAPPTVYYRPGYGACNERTIAMADKMGLYTVLWSWAHYDYDEQNQPDPAAALEKAKKGLHNGAVYLFHTVGPTNAAILGDFIDYVRAEGYEIRPIMG